MNVRPLGDLTTIHPGGGLSQIGSTHTADHFERAAAVRLEAFREQVSEDRQH